MSAVFAGKLRLRGHKCLHADDDRAVQVFFTTTGPTHWAMAPPLLMAKVTERDDGLQLPGAVPADRVKIAVIMVARNALPALKETIRSIRTINDPRILPIIIDGASTDGTAAWIQSLVGWAYHMRSEPDRGIYDAMNKAWREVPDDALTLFLGAGDLLLELPPDDRLRAPGGAPWNLVLGDTSVGPAPYRSRWCSEIRLRNTAHHQAMLVCKKLAPEPPFDTSFPVYADWDFNLRLYRRGVRARYVSGLRTYAEPGGASWSMDLAELRRVSQRNGGWLIGTASWGVNAITRWRRRRRESLAQATRP